MKYVDFDNSGADKFRRILDGFQCPLEENIEEILIDALGQTLLESFEVKCKKDGIKFESEEYFNELNKLIKDNSSFEDLKSLFAFQSVSRLLEFK